MLLRAAASENCCCSRSEVSIEPNSLCPLVWSRSQTWNLMNVSRSFKHARDSDTWNSAQQRKQQSEAARQVHDRHGSGTHCRTLARRSRRRPLTCGRLGTRHSPSASPAGRPKTLAAVQPRHIRTPQSLAARPPKRPLRNHPDSIVSAMAHRGSGGVRGRHRGLTEWRRGVAVHGCSQPTG